MTRESRVLFGYSFTKWVICKRLGVWAVIPPRGYVVQRGGEFASGAEALAAFASGGRA